MRIIFVRHGESEGNLQGKIQGREDYCLSPSGVRQAKKLKNYFYNQKLVISHLYSSPLKRAFETAKILSELWEIEIKSESGLQEYDMGRLSGADKETLEEKIPETKKYRVEPADEYFDRIQSKNLLGVESAFEARDRATRTLDTFFQKHDDNNVILCVSHGGIMQRFVEIVLGTNRMWKMEIRNTAIFDFDLQSQSHKAIELGNFRDNIIVNKINSFNDDMHLAKS